MDFVGTSTKMVSLKQILIFLCFGIQSIATIASSGLEPSNLIQHDPPKNRNAIASNVANLFANKEVFVKDNMLHLFYKVDKSTLRDDVNFDEVVVCKAKWMDHLKTYNYKVCPDDAGSRWPSYSQLIRDSSSVNTYCCYPAGMQTCCSKTELYFYHPEFRPTEAPTNVRVEPAGNSNNVGSGTVSNSNNVGTGPEENSNKANTRSFDLQLEEKPKKKMATSTIVIIVSCSIAGLLIIVAIACLICCLCNCCCFAMFNKSNPTGGKIAGGYATKTATVTPGAYRATNSTAAAYPAGGSYDYPSGGAYPAGSGGYAGGYAGGYPANVR